MRDRGCKQIVSVTDREVYGRGVGTLVRQDAARLGLQVVRTVRISQRTRSFGRIRGADCVVYTGVTANGAVRMFRSAGARLRNAQLFASDGVAESGFTRRLPASIARRVTRDRRHARPGRLPGGAAIIGSGDPYKIYGYEAMKLILDGLNAAGPTKEGLLGYLRTGVQNRAERARHLLARRQRRHHPAHLRPLRHPAQAARRGHGAAITAGVSSAMPSSVSVPETSRSASTSRQSPAGSFSSTGSPRSSAAASTSPPRTNATASGPARSGS